MPENNIDDVPNDAALVLVHAVRVAALPPAEGVLVIADGGRRDPIQRLTEQWARFEQEWTQDIAAIMHNIAESRQDIAESQRGIEELQQKDSRLRRTVAGVRREMAGARQAAARYSTTTIKAYNHTCGNGVNQNYEEMPFQDGSMPTERHGRHRRPLPAILTYDNIRELTMRQLGIYLRGYGVHPIPRGALARRTYLGRAIGLSGTLIRTLEAQ